jgi:hypothetical protein
MLIRRNRTDSHSGIASSIDLAPATLGALADEKADEEFGLFASTDHVKFK